MKGIEMTSRSAPAIYPAMPDNRQSKGRTCLKAGILMAATSLLAGCINVNAPTEPIVIELNINIRQEVIYRLAEDVRENIEENADIF